MLVGQFFNLLKSPARFPSNPMTPQSVSFSTSTSTSLSNSPTTKTSRTNLSLMPRLTVECLLNILNDRTDFVPYTIDYSNFEASSLELLKLVFPEWLANSKTNWKNHLKLAQCTDGITNKRKSNQFTKILFLCFISVRTQISNEM